MDKQAYLTKRNHAQKVKFWFSALQQFKRHWKKWDFKDAALLVVDAQNYFFDSASHAYVPSAEFVKEQIQTLVERFRAKNRPVIFTVFAVEKGEPDVIFNWWKESVKAGSHEAGLSLAAERNSVIRKTTYSAFLGTALEKILKKKGVKKLVIAGVLTNLCCETTAREAFNRGYDVFMVADATAAYNEDMHLSALKNLSYGFATPISTGQL